MSSVGCTNFFHLSPGELTDQELARELKLIVDRNINWKAARWPAGRLLIDIGDRILRVEDGVKIVAKRVTIVAKEIRLLGNFDITCDHVEFFVPPEGRFLGKREYEGWGRKVRVVAYDSPQASPQASPPPPDYGRGSPEQRLVGSGRDSAPITAVLDATWDIERTSEGWLVIKSVKTPRAQIRARSADSDFSQIT